MMRSFLVRKTFTRPSFVAITSRATPITSLRYASGDYGSGAGDPKGDNPQSQGANPSADKEHPGPPPPSVGQGTGSGPTKGTAEGHNTSAAEQGSGGKEADKDAGRSGKTQGAQPKILSTSPPPAEDADEDVRKHNEEMDNRAEKAHEKVSDEQVDKDKVGKGFWYVRPMSSPNPIANFR